MLRTFPRNTQVGGKKEKIEEENFDNFFNLTSGMARNEQWESINFV